jgi:hypothetical protein
LFCGSYRCALARPGGTSRVVLVKHKYATLLRLPCQVAKQDRTVSIYCVIRTDNFYTVLAYQF